jgi:hypothetical protein
VLKQVLHTVEGLAVQQKELVVQQKELVVQQKELVVRVQSESHLNKPSALHLSR